MQKFFRILKGVAVTVLTLCSLIVKFLVYCSIPFIAVFWSLLKKSR